MKWYLIALLPLMAGCGLGGTPTSTTPICEEHSATEVKLPDGSKGGVICCQHRADCYKLGTKVCGTYDITLANNATASDFATGDRVAEYVLSCHTSK